MNEYMTISETAKKWNLTKRRVQKMCSDGVIKGVIKFGTVWAIPKEAERPKDGRVKAGKYRDWREKYGCKTKEDCNRLV